MRRHNRLVSGLSVLLSVVLIIELGIAGFVCPGFLRKKEDDTPPVPVEESFASEGTEAGGISDIRLTEEDYGAEAERIQVLDALCCLPDSGVCVDFGGNADECAGKELSVKTLGSKNDGRYEARVYDFSLTDTTEFAAPVEITLPYDPAWGENVFVQYYNEDTSAWELLWTESDGAGNALFHTDHFSTFAVFRDMVTGSAALTAEDPVITFLGDPSGMDGSICCSINYAALAGMVRNGQGVTLSALGSSGDTYRAEQTMGLMSNIDSAAGYALDAADIAAGSDTIFKSASTVLNRLGYGITAAKVFTQYYRTGDMLGAVVANKADLAEAGLSVAAELTGGAVSTGLGIAALAVFVASSAQSTMEDINLRGCEDKIEYGYRAFTGEYATCILSSKGIFCSSKYAPTEYERLSNLTWNTNEIPLTDHKGLSSADWQEPFMFIAEHYGYADVPAAVDNLLTQYVNIFWNLERNDSDTFNTYLENAPADLSGTDTLKSVYKTPSKAERQAYTARYKADLYSWLKPDMNALMERAYFKMLNSVFVSAHELEEALNAQLTFTLADPGKDRFADSVYATCDCDLVLSETGAAIWHFTAENNWSISCTRLMYLYAGSPMYVRVSKRSETLLVKQFTPTGDTTVITLGDAEMPAEIPTEVPSEENDAYWVLSEIVYTPSSGNLEDVAIDSDGEETVWIGSRMYREIQVTNSAARGTIEKCDGSTGDTISRAEWKLEFPGAVLADSSEFTYSLWGSDSFWAEDWLYCTLYPDRKYLQFADAGASGYRTVSGNGVIPDPQEGGSRVIMVYFFDDLGLVYRECDFAEAADTVPKTVEMNPYEYWKNVLGQE